MRLRLLAVIVSAVAAACTATTPETEVSASVNTSGPHEPVTITYWVTATGSDLARFNRALEPFKEQYPWITIHQVGNVTDPTRVIAAVNAGHPPDVWHYWTPDTVPEMCADGALTDLTPYIERDQLDMSQFSQYWLGYMKSGDEQCALPSISDAYGLYYNEGMLQEAGISEPPKTMSELAADAKKLTVRNPDGSIEVAGFIPLMSFYDQWIPNWTQPFGVTWLDDQGKPDLANDPAWTEMFEWQKSLVDWYGYQNLQKFVAGLGENYSAQHAGETGKVAMWLDGEWRISFIRDDHPSLDYGTAPQPVADDHPELYGSGLIASNIVTIPTGAAHPEEAWLLVKYLAANYDFLVEAAQTEVVIPSTTQALQAPELTSDPHLETFLQIYQNPRSSYYPAAAASGGMPDMVASFDEKWVAGNVPDLDEGLVNLDQQIENQMQQGAT